MENTKLHADLSKIDGTYTKAITDNLNSINSAYNNKSVGTIEFKSLILSIVNSDLVKKTPGQKRFVMNLSKKKSKDQILYYVYDAQLSGSGDKVIS